MTDEIRTQFIIEFTRSLIKNSTLKIENIEPEQELEVEQTEPLGQIAEVQEIEHTEYEKLGPRQIKSIKEIEPYDPSTKKIQSQRFNPSIATTGDASLEINNSPELQSIKDLLSDPTIENIECSGADKNIVIKRGGRIFESKKRLSKEEINKIIQEFSSRSGEKLDQGILRTKIGSLKILAVISKFAGDRFVISKNY